MSLHSAWKAMSDECCMMVCGTKTDHMITGTKYVSVSKDRTVTITYEGGTIETRIISEALLATIGASEANSVFQLVGFVQGRIWQSEKRGKKERGGRIGMNCKSHNAPAHLPSASGGKVPPVVGRSESERE